MHGTTNAPWRYPWLFGRDLSEYPRSSPKVEMETGWIPTFASMVRRVETDDDDALTAEWRKKHDPGLIRFYGEVSKDDPLLSYFYKGGKTVWRPFEGFPHCWMAIDMIARSLRHSLARERDRLARREDAGVSPEDSARRNAASDRIDREAQQWCTRTANAASLDEPSPSDKEEFWAWMESLHVDTDLDRTTAGGLSLRFELTKKLSDAAVLSSEAMLRDESARDRVPEAVVHALRNRHTVLREHMFRDGTVYQHQMFGRGRIIQYVADEMDDTHHLLLQLSPDDGLDWDMGDAGAFQYWITPQDLPARRFENVVLTFECH